MKKMSLTLLTIVMVMSALLMSAHAGPPTAAAGDWLYMPTVEGVRVADGNTFKDTSEVGIWTGTFDGTSTEVGRVVRHSSGLVYFKGTVSFVGSVNGQSGSLEMSVVGWKADATSATSKWEGKWVILNGTEDLADLQGQGTWGGPGYNPQKPDEMGIIKYEGNVHFQP